MRLPRRFAPRNDGGIRVIVDVIATPTLGRLAMTDNERFL
jgi:hypothetical protein